MEPLDNWYSRALCMDQLHHWMAKRSICVHADTKLEWLLLWFFGSILAFTSCTIHWEDSYQNYGRGAILYKTWQSVFYHINLFNGSVLTDFHEQTQLSRRQMNTVTDHSSFQRIRFNWKWEQKFEHPALLDPDETPNQSCSSQNTDLILSAASAEHFMMILLHHIKPKQNQAKKKQKLHLITMQGNKSKSYFSNIIRQGVQSKRLVVDNIFKNILKHEKQCS